VQCITSCDSILALLLNESPEAQTVSTRIQSLYDTFIKEGATNELNLTQANRTDIQQAITNINFAQVQATMEMLRGRCVAHLYASFTRFKRSPEFVKFVNNSTVELLQTFGVHTSQTITLAPEDLTNQYISHKEVKFANLLLKDYYHWKPLYASMYICKIPSTS